MEVKASHRFADISPRKARLVVDLVRGQRVDEALETLRITRKRASGFIVKVMRAAAAAADDRHDLDIKSLRISRIWVDGGPVRRKFWARPRGMWARKLRRTSHINVVLCEDAAAAEE